MTGVLLASLFGLNAFAKEHHSEKKHGNAVESHVTYRQSSASSASGKSVGFGFSTLTGVLTSPSLTMTIDLTEMDTVQALASIGSTNPFQFSAGAIYKRTVSGSQETGFHVGGGFALGNPGTLFAFNLSALAGFHFSIPGLSQVRFHLDGGPSFTFVNTPVASTTQFMLQPLSPALGASIVYIF